MKRDGGALLIFPDAGESISQRTVAKEQGRSLGAGARLMRLNRCGLVACSSVA
jgi:hypothetical protein